ncbi:MAG: site-specific integrase [Marinobacter sp.]|nr:site-specific integrase [Marinobacter sp.]
MWKLNILSPELNTLLAYRDAIKLLLCYAADTLHKNVDKLNVEEIDELLVLAFLDHLEDDRGCSPRTRNARLAAIRVFFAFIAREEPILLLQCQRIRTIPLKRTQLKTVDYLEEPEMQALLDMVDINSRTGVRDKALLLLLYNTGGSSPKFAVNSLRSLTFLACQGNRIATLLSRCLGFCPLLKFIHIEVFSFLPDIVLFG